MVLKIDKPVPPGIRYLTQWEEFKLENFPNKCILHKQIPGCGLTEYALTCPYPVVLCSPRKMLMENKKDQHGDDVFLVVSEFDRGENIDSDISKPESSNSISSKSKEEEFWNKIKEQVEKNTYSTLFHEIQQYMNSLEIGKYPKIIVTYDSSYLVKRVLEQMNLLDNFWFIVDEFQSLLEDARFKVDVETEFLNILQDIPQVMYVSATPMLDKYLEQIPEFKFLPYYILNWGSLDPTRIKKPDLKVRTMSSITSRMKEIIQSYLEGRFEKVVVEREGQLIEVESRECVIYVNSVNHILNIIKKFNDDPALPNLDPSLVNILCSDTPENRKRINKKLGKEYKIGKVPLRGEPHKMFTFCTRTVYLGADFYSLCARSFIFSDSNSDCLSVDISMDLAQILGRQRLEENPWHNSAEFYYRTTCDYKKMTQEDFQKIIDEKEKRTLTALSLWEKGTEEEKNNNARDLLYIAKSLKYKENYVSVHKVDDGSLIPILNLLVKINDIRAFEIQQIDYADRFSVFSSLIREFNNSSLESGIITSFFLEYDKLNTYIDKCKMICEFLINNPSLSDIVINNLSDHDKIKQQIITIGPERMKGLGYNITRIKEAMGITIFNWEELNDTIYSTFKIGERYTKKYIKNKLGEVYKAADIKESSKANQLENWFKIRECKISKEGKREMGFEILSRK